GSPEILRKMEGHGFLITRIPPLPFPTGWPVSSTTSAAMPGSGVVADPGLVAVTPGSGVIMCPPVSVCHQVSTIGQRLLPTVSWYHIHASGLIGSPTVPRMRSDDRSYFFGRSPPALMSERIAVGAV